jgi:hypothetical protein
MLVGAEYRYIVERSNRIGETLKEVRGSTEFQQDRH